MTQLREPTKNPAVLPGLTKAQLKQRNNEVRPHPVLDLQRSAGNQAVLQLLGSSPSTARAAPESKEKVFNDVVSAVKSDLDQAWSDATRTWKEWGGFIVRNESSGEIKVEDYKQGQAGMKIEWRVGKYRAPAGYEVIGEFHTHQYSPDEVKDWQKDVPSFTGEDVGFNFGDLTAAASCCNR